MDKEKKVLFFYTDSVKIKYRQKFCHRTNGKKPAFSVHNIIKNKHLYPSVFVGNNQSDPLYCYHVI